MRHPHRGALKEEAELCKEVHPRDLTHGRVTSKGQKGKYDMIPAMCTRMDVRVCVCVRVQERERDTDSICQCTGKCNREPHRINTNRE